MNKARMDKAKQALTTFINKLPPDSYFNIISFGSYFEKMYSRSIKCDDRIIKSTLASIQRMSANYGGNEIYYALEAALTERSID